MKGIIFTFRPAIAIGYALIHNISEFLQLVPADSNIQVQYMVDTTRLFKISQNNWHR